MSITCLVNASIIQIEGGIIFKKGALNTENAIYYL